MKMRSEIAVPKFLQELHGERTPLSTLLLTYLAGLACAGFVARQLALAGVAPWRIAVAAMIFLDIGGGVVANFSQATNRYYQEHVKLRLPFIFLHIFHPAVLIALFPAGWPYFLFVMVYTLIATLTINSIKAYEMQQSLASFLVAVGVATSILFSLPAKVFFILAPLFMIKLVLGFAVKRPFAPLQ